MFSVYYLGALPFWLAFVYFFFDMTQSADADAHLPREALLLTVLYFGMKTCQAVFARKLLALDVFDLRHRLPRRWYVGLHAAARRMTEIARALSESPPPLIERALKQLARELLLAQSSDWAFLIKTGTAREYATKRAKDHLLRFNRLHDQLSAGNIDEEFLGDCEWRDNIFPNVNWRYYI